MTDTTNVLRDVAREVLADFAFLLTEPAQAPLAWPAAELVRHAEIDFEGPFCGTLAITATSELAEAIACDMLGLEAGDPEAVAQSASALGELANVVAGAVIARLFGTSSNYKLGLPQVAHGHPRVDVRPREVLALEDMEGRPIEIQLHKPAGAGK
jgi:CheY-specific phosphatase CheX